MDHEPVISNLSHIFLFLPNDKIMLKCKKAPSALGAKRSKCPCFVLELPKCDKKSFLLTISIYQCQAKRY